MAEFTPITIESQEQLDGMFKDRLNRQSEKHAKEMAELKTQYSDYDSLKEANDGFKTQIEQLTGEITGLNDIVKGYDSQIAERDTRIKAYEQESMKMKIVSDLNLSLEAIEFLKGDTEDEIRKSAERLSKIAPKPIAPLASSAASGEANGVMAAFYAKHPELKK